MKMTTNILLDSLKEYYKNEKNMSRLLEVILQTNNKISLRIIDWFVTNYSKKNNIYYSIYQTEQGEKTFTSENNVLLRQFNTYHGYKSQLKSYSKKKFDPFCRRERIKFEYGENNSIETTKYAPRYSLNLSVAFSYPNRRLYSNCKDFNFKRTESVIRLLASTINSFASTVPWNRDTRSN